MIDPWLNLIGVYLVCAITAQLIHIVSGVWMESYAEVRRQVIELYEEIGASGYALFVLSGGLLPRSKSDDNIEEAPA